MITKTLMRQTKQIFGTLLKSLALCPGEDFGLDARGAHDSIGRIAAHIGSSIEGAFLTDEFRSRWNSPVSTRDECIEYLASCRDDLLIPFIASEKMEEADPEPAYFVSKLDRVMKILRHVAHHTGEISSLLRVKGMEGASFV